MNTLNNSKKNSEQASTGITTDENCENAFADFPEIDLEILKQVPGGANQTRAGRGRGAARG